MNGIIPFGFVRRNKFRDTDIASHSEEHSAQVPSEEGVLPEIIYSALLNDIDLR